MENERVESCVAPAIFGTLVTSAFAILFAVPIGVGTAIFLVDFCPRPLQRPLAFIVLGDVSFLAPYKHLILGP